MVILYCQLLPVHSLNSFVALTVSKGAFFVVFSLGHHTAEAFSPAHIHWFCFLKEELSKNFIFF